ncbi:MAG: esterase-like activity of phytase family protein [Gammaproteobacteria bacterium]|nr:esterase-like activity of phytase family protein [Gammaproteobacteria bacterium]
MHRRLAAALLGLATSIAAADEGAFSTPFSFAPAHAAASGPVRECGAVRLHGARAAGEPVHELSALAWDADEDRLYALSDRGYIVHLRPRFRGGRLHSVEHLATYPLLDSRGQPLPRDLRDAEGLVARRARNGRRGDTELVVAFEIAPRLMAYTPQGRPRGGQALPRELEDSHSYRGSNRQLEGLTDSADHGFVVVPERPLLDAPAGQVTLYAQDGVRWEFRPFDPPHAAMVALETMPGGDLLALERRLVNLFHPIVFVIYRVSPGAGSGAVPARELARFDNSAGWAVDNFEGLARYVDSRYLMVSDDNGSALQATILVCLDIDEARSAP